MNGYALSAFPVHLGLGATAEIEPEFTGAMQWYEDYSARHEKDGAEGRIVSQAAFESSWTSWEMHPSGSEVVICVTGALTLHQEIEAGKTVTIRLEPGQYAINPPGIWHTADVDEPTTAIFITAGWGTQGRPR